MDWVLNHLQLIIAIAGAIAYWIIQNKKGGEQADLPPADHEKTFADPELAERTRQIREEIQRKIEQRARGYANEQPKVMRSEPAEPPPIVREVVVTQQAPPVLRRATTHAEAQRNAEILEQQAALAEQLRQAQEMKAAAARRTQFEARISSDKEEIAAAVTRGALADDLRNTDALRRAFILREVLGPPVALRG